MNRTKTKKWVEAKVQNYDGDDWGGDEYDDEESEEEAPPPLPKTSTHAAGTREATLPSLQTQNSPAVSAPASQSRPITVASPVVSEPLNMSSHPSQFQTVSHHTAGTTESFGGPSNQPMTGSAAQASEPAMSEQQKPLPARPSDTYRRMEEEKEKEPKSLDSGNTRPDSMGRDAAFNVGHTVATPSRDNVDEGRRDSISPKLPDLARMSAFGADLFSPTGSTGIPKDEPIVEQESEAGSLSPSIAKAEAVPLVVQPEESRPQDKTPTLETQKKEHEDEETSGADQEKEGSITIIPPTESEYTSATEEMETKKDVLPTTNPGSHKLSKDNIPVLQPDSDMHVIAPLRTPSPRGPARPAPDTSMAPPAATGKTDGASIKAADDNPEVNFEPKSVQREATFSTVASSPVKDNDLLSDEILKSLSPVGSSEPFIRTAAGTGSQSSNRNAARDSSYTLQDYDSYWDDTEDKTKSPDTSAPIPTIPEVPDAQSEVMSQSTVSPTDKPTESLVSPQSLNLRRRFSWEADESGSTPAKASPTVTPSGVPATQNRDLGVGPPAVDVKAQEENKRPTDGPIGGVGVSPHVSNVSSTHPPSSQHPALESPSPISPSSDNTPGIRAVNRLSVAEEEAVEQPNADRLSSGPASDGPAALNVQTSPSPSPVPAPSMTQQAQAQIMSFREIMSLNTSSQRIAKYNETRKIFSSTDSGLDNWLIHLQAQRPDMASSGPLFAAQGPQQASQGPNATTAAGTQPAPAQQPYYQQYLNASSPTTASSSPTGRNRLAGLPIPTPASGSTFGHSGNQIGTKSKELMQSAGKLSKGLLSKGRSKLRGTGDKVFH